MIHSRPLHSRCCLGIVLAGLFLVAHPALGMEPSMSMPVSFIQVTNASSCPPVFLPQNVNGLNGPYTFNLWALEGCSVVERVDLTLTYSFALFGISSSTGVTPGPNYVLGKTTSTKGAGYTDLSLTLYRVGEAATGELLASFSVQASIVFPLMGSGTLEWTAFSVDNGADISGQIPPVLITWAATPSEPVLRLPGPITSTSVEVNWFPNPDNESVSVYTASVNGPTGEVAAMVVPATQTTVMLGGLAPGTAYNLGLTATNASGESRMALLPFVSRYEETVSQRDLFLEQLGHEWNPTGVRDGSLQSVIPSPADMDLDGVVNAEDALAIVQDHLGRTKP